MNRNMITRALVVGWGGSFFWSALLVALVVGLSCTRSAKANIISWTGDDRFGEDAISFSGFNAGTLTSITDTSSTPAYYHDHGGDGMSVTLDLEVDGVFTTVFSRTYSGDGSQQYISDITTPISFTPGTVTGIRFTSDPHQDYSFHNFDSDLKFAFAPAAVPEPSSMILLGTGLMSLMGYGARRRKRRLTECAA